MTRTSLFNFKTSLIGLLMFSAIGFFAGAANAQSTIITVNPNHSIVAGVEALNEGRPKVAVKHFERALRRNLTQNQLVMVYNNLCVARNYLGDSAKAIQACERALDLDPTYWRAALNLGNVYFDQGNWLAAHDEYTRALALNPNEDAIRLNLELVERTQTASAK